MKVNIYFTAVGMIDIPSENDIQKIMQKISSNPKQFKVSA